MSKPWILCVQYHGKLWLGFHMNNSVCCSYAFCCQIKCHILGFYRWIRKDALLKMCSSNWEKVFRLQLSSANAAWRTGCFIFFWTMSYQSFCFFPAPTLNARPLMELGELLMLKNKNKKKKRRVIQKGLIARDHFPVFSDFSLKAVKNFPWTSVRTRQDLTWKTMWLWDKHTRLGCK